MAYKRITPLDIWEIIRRRYDKQSISHIAKVFGYDWKTVKKFIHYAQEQGLDFDQPLPPKEHVLHLFQDAAVEQRRPLDAGPRGRLGGRGLGGLDGRLDRLGGLLSRAGSNRSNRTKGRQHQHNAKYVHVRLLPILEVR